MFWYYKNHEIELRQSRWNYELFIDHKKITEETMPLMNKFDLRGKIYEDNYIEGKKPIAVATVTVNQLTGDHRLRVDSIQQQKTHNWDVDRYRHRPKAEWTECGDENIQKYGGILIRPHLDMPIEDTPSEFINQFDIVSITRDENHGKYLVLETVFNAKQFIDEYEDLLEDVHPELLEDIPADVHRNAIPIESAASVFNEFAGLIAHDNAKNDHKLYKITSHSFDSNELADFLKKIDYPSQDKNQIKEHRRHTPEREA